MNIIMCIDDNGGLLFNHRRQSKDVVVTDKIKELVTGHTLWIHSFSSSLLGTIATVDDEMLLKASADDFCFVENMLLTPYIDKIDAVYLFKWNRKYPSDFKMDLQLQELFHLVSTMDFPGHSHENITLEVWSR